jgi:diguanylate cyclase (GGDEF)-like protein/PAS domain S-box-containing protein
MAAARGGDPEVGLRDPADVLVRAGAQLLDAASTAEVAAVAARTVHELLRRHGDGPVAAYVAEGGVLAPAAAPGRTGSRRAGATTTVALARLPAEVQRRLEGGRPFEVAPADLGLPAHAELLVLPLASRGVLHGAVLAERRPSCRLRGRCPCRGALASLAVHCALALDALVLLAQSRVTEQRFRAMVQHGTDVIAVVTPDGRACYVSPAVATVLGRTPEDAALAGLHELVHPDDAERWAAFLADRAASPGSDVVECRFGPVHGRWRHLEVRGTNLLHEPTVNGILLNLRDVSERATLEADLAHLAYHDALTNLPNRTLFFERMRAALADPKRRRRLAVLFIDLDGFKAVNDRLGHAGGDELLVAVAQRLRAGAPPESCVARLSGDEFAVLDEGGPIVDHAEHAEALALRLLDLLDAPITVQRETVRIRASIGVAVGTNGVEDAGDLLHRADLAMYSAKSQGRGRCTVFDLTTHQSLGVQRQLRAELAQAFTREELEVRFQPIVVLRDERVRSAEALVRWRHPERGLLGPALFVPLLEEEGLASNLFELVLRRAIAQARVWRDHLGAAAPSVAVNLSPPLLHERGLVRLVETELAQAQLDPACLTLELTENVLVTDPDAAARVMSALKERGVRLAIDDFGTGYSSLAYLRALPVDVLKVDKTFVDGLGSRDPSGTLARTIIELGRRLGLRTVAEGVETDVQRRLLREYGCDDAQGYLFSRPLHGGRITELVRAQARARTSAA